MVTNLKHFVSSYQLQLLFCQVYLLVLHFGKFFCCTVPVKASSHTQGFTESVADGLHPLLTVKVTSGKINEEGEWKVKKRAFPLYHANTTLQANISYWMFSPVEQLFLRTVFHLVATAQISSKCVRPYYSYSCLKFCYWILKY